MVVYIFNVSLTSVVCGKLYVLMELSAKKTSIHTISCTRVETGKELP
jgi:hypothetical protein